MITRLDKILFLLIVSISEAENATCSQEDASSCHCTTLNDSNLQMCGQYSMVGTQWCEWGDGGDRVAGWSCEHARVAGEGKGDGVA
jgi:hypothetical protein